MSKQTNRPENNQTFHKLETKLMGYFNQKNPQSPDCLRESSLLNFCRLNLDLAKNDIQKAFEEQYPISQLLQLQAFIVDQCLIKYWNFLFKNHQKICLVAVGGYGRNSLHPYSDIDLLILHDPEKLTNNLEKIIQRFLAGLWDIGLKISINVRTIQSCLDYAEKDITIMTNLMEMRPLCGEITLVKQLSKQLFQNDKLWPIEQYFTEHLYHKMSRQKKYANSAYTLEPDIKYSPGNLRDIHVLTWLACRCFNTSESSILLQKNILNQHEMDNLNQCYDFLCKIRWILHQTTHQNENRLLFEHQKMLAKIMGYQDLNKKNLAVEQFMQHYYQTIIQITRFQDIALQFFDSYIKNKQKKIKKSLVINNNFIIKNDYIEVKHPEVFIQHPPAIMELFVWSTHFPDILGASATTIRLLIQSNHLVNAAFRSDPRVHRLFLQLMSNPYNLAPTLKKMIRYGILGQYLPQFEKIIGKMQFDLFHIHTVDVHTVLVIDHLVQFFNKNDDNDVISPMHKAYLEPRILYITALYHDIAKGRGTDHSIAGAADAKNFCATHNISQEETKLITWLIENHLIMSNTIQRKDIDDLMVIKKFAEIVENIDRLTYLYIFTIADVQATNPKLWNDWRATLMKHLYQQTYHLLKIGLGNIPSKTVRVQQKQTAALNKLNLNQDQKEKVNLFWNDIDHGYFLRHSSDELMWHATQILSHQLTYSSPLIAVKESYAYHSGGSRVFIYLFNRPNIFTILVSTLDQLNLCIQDACVYKAHQKQIALHTFTVLDNDDKAIKDKKRIQAIQDRLLKSLTPPYELPKLIKRRAPYYIKHFSIEPLITLSQSLENRYLIIDLKANDCPGLLAGIGYTFMMLGLQVQKARIGTFGEKVEDSFVVRGSDQNDFTNPDYCKTIVTTLAGIVKSYYTDSA